MIVSLQDLVLIVAALLIPVAWYTKRRTGLPPGPPGYPYFGTPLKHVKGARWFLYTEWAKKYGDLVYFENHGRGNLVLNTYEAAHDLLVLRSRIYSDRPKMVMARELVGYNNSIVLADNTPRTVFMRKAVQTEISPKKLPRFRHIQNAEIELMLGKLLENPSDFMEHLRMMIAYMVFSIAYGYRPRSDNDKLLVMIKKMMEDFALFAAPGNFLVDNFPILKYLPSWFPGAGFISFGKAAAGRINAVCAFPFDMVKERQAKLVAGELQPSVTASFLQHPDITPEKEHALRWSSEAVYAAGSDTTYSSILTFVLAMVRNPHVQAKAQAEIDAYLDLDTYRLLTLDDGPHLPYVDKVFWEVLRWYPVIPLGIPHRVAQDDVYQGHRIPKDTTVIANIWKVHFSSAILHDEILYPDPWTFNPDRYGASSNQENSINQDPRKAVFGFGKRQCPGMHLAEATVWLAMVNILAVYDITPVKDPKTGEPIIPPLEGTPGVLSKPVAFPCVFKPRSAKAEKLVRKVYEEAKPKIEILCQGAA